MERVPPTLADDFQPSVSARHFGGGSRSTVDRQAVRVIEYQNLLVRKALMMNVMTTKMSSKGQVVLPEALREMNGWGVGTAFTLMMYKGSLIMQPIRTPTESELVAEFDEAFEESRRQAREAGMTPADVRRVIAEVRSEHAARRSGR